MYINVAYNLLPYKMVLASLTIQSNSNLRHCHPMYSPQTDECVCVTDS